MASFTVQSSQKFPDGTVVGAYPRTAWPLQVGPPTGAPTGAAVSTATAAGGQVLFSGLADNTLYVAYAGSPDRYLAFRTPPVSAGSGIGDPFVGEPRVRGRADLVVAAAPPVRTRDTHVPPFAPDNSRFIKWDNPLIRRSPAAMVPSVTGAAAPGTPSVGGYVTANLTGGATESLQGALPFRWDMILEGSFIAVPLESPLNGTPKVHLYVNGQLATADEEAISGGMNTWTFSGRGPWELCFSFKAAGVKGVHIPLDGDLLPVPWSKGPQVFFVGDSLTESAVATSILRGYAHIASWLLGFDNYEVNSWGGTGYLQTSAGGGGTRPNARDRIGTDLIPRLTASDLVVWVLGVNDAAQDPVALKAAAKACYAAVAATGAKQIVFGPWYQEGAGVQQVAAHQTIRAAASESGLPFIPTMNYDRWLRGDGHAGQPASGIGPAITGNGNSDRYSSGTVAGQANTQSVHPVNEGHIAMGRWVAGRLRRALQPSYLTPTFTPGAFPIAAAPSFWVKADTITGLADGAAVSQWNDQSGNNNHPAQATPASQPLYKVNIVNGLPVVRFDGSNDELVVPAGVAVQHAFVVAKYTPQATFTGASGLFGGATNTDPDIVLRAAGPATQEVQTLTGTATGGTFTLTYDDQTTAAIAFNATAAQIQTALQALKNLGVAVTCAGGPLGTAGVTVTFALGLGTRLLLTVNATNLTGGTVTVARTTTGVPGKMMTGPTSSTSIRYWLNGEEWPKTSMRGPGNAFACMSVKSTEWTNPLLAHIGSQAGSLFWNGDVAEIITYPTVLSDADRVAVEHYLMNKWGIVNWRAL